MSEYKRLTQWTENGASLDLGEPNSPQEARERLTTQFKKACNKLAELEDRIEERRLIQIPCKVRDTIYYITGGHQKKIIPAIVTHTHFEIEDGHLSGYVTTLDPNDSCDDCWKMGAFKKRWFTIREAAEARLKELEEKQK